MEPIQRNRVLKLSPCMEQRLGCIIRDNLIPYIRTLQMRLLTCVGVALLLTSSGISAFGEKQPKNWKIGRVLDESRARYFAGMLHNSSSQSSESGTLSGNANSTSYGDSTDTTMNGNYSGTSHTTTSGSSIPMYRVYDNLVIEGEDAVYITSERLRWRWSKGAHVAVNGTVKYYVDGRKLHVLDDDQKEHSIEILKTVLKPVSPAKAAAEPPQPVALPNPATASSQASLTIDSSPSGADIEVDGAFVGSTPSTISIAYGHHEVDVRKKGFAVWSRTLNVTGGTVRLNAELDQEK
jgi:hypothetical protein